MRAEFHGVLMLAGGYDGASAERAIAPTGAPTSSRSDGRSSPIRSSPPPQDLGGAQYAGSGDILWRHGCRLHRLSGTCLSHSRRRVGPGKVARNVRNAAIRLEPRWFGRYSAEMAELVWSGLTDHASNNGVSR